MWYGEVTGEIRGMAITSETYNIQEELVEKVNDGHHLAIEICHPDFGEVMIAKILPREEYTDPLTV